MPSPYQKDILAQILDGKRRWANAEAEGDPDVFKTQVVVPLRQLKYEGVIDQLEEVEAEIEGRSSGHRCRNYRSNQLSPRRGLGDGMRID